MKATQHGEHGKFVPRIYVTLWEGPRYGTAGGGIRPPPLNLSIDSGRAG